MVARVWSQRQATLLMQRWKESHPCADCHLFYRYYQMEFDHNPSLGKVVNLGTEGKTLSEIELRREMAKCETVCCNCHAVRTWHRLCGLRLGAAASRAQGRYLPPGASLTPWAGVDTSAKTERVQGGRPDSEKRSVLSWPNLRILSRSGLPN